MKDALIKYTPDFLFPKLANEYYRLRRKKLKITTYWVITKGNISLCSPTPKFLGMHTLESFQAKFERFFKIEKKDFCVDVGACIGDTTVPMAIKTGVDGHVIAIEPDTLNIKFLSMNLIWALNTQIIPLAVWKYKTTLNLNIHNTPTGHSLVKLDKEYKGTEKIEAYPLDNLLNAFPKIDFLKIDVQGAEIEALLGAKETLKKTHKIVVETHGFGASSLYQQVARTIRKQGFKVQVTSDRMVHGWKP